MENTYKRDPPLFHSPFFQNTNKLRCVSKTGHVMHMNKKNGNKL